MSVFEYIQKQIRRQSYNKLMKAKIIKPCNTQWDKTKKVWIKHNNMLAWDTALTLSNTAAVWELKVLVWHWTTSIILRTFLRQFLLSFMLGHWQLHLRGLYILGAVHLSAVCAQQPQLTCSSTGYVAQVSLFVLALYIRIC